MYEDPKSKISQLGKVLDAREDKVSNKAKRHELHDHESTANEDWNDSEFAGNQEAFAPHGVGLEVGTPSSFSGGSVPEAAYEKKKGMSASIKILLGSVIFFLIALAVVSYQFLGGGNIVSGDNIEITVKAPISIAGGEVLPFELEIKNNNNVKLSGVDLGINFPDGSRQVEDTSVPAKRIQEFLGDINPGQSVKKNLGVVLFGAENESKDIKITLEYKVVGSNSLFNKNKVLSVLISSSPVSIVVKGPKEVNTNQAVEYTVEVTSNSTSVLKNLLLKAEYPFGFTFTKSDPSPFSKNNLWLIGDLAPGAKRIIKFSGLVSGQEGEARGFNFSLGSQSKIDSLVIDTPFTTSFSSLTIRRPFVSADIFLNDEDTKEYVSSAGGAIEAVIHWQNNLPYEVSDVSIVVKISGNALDKSSVEVDSGFYRSVDNTIVFDKNTNPSFRNLGPGESGESKFEFNSFGAGSVTGSGLSNPIITLDVSVQGRRTEFGGSPEDVLFSDSRRVKITSNPQLSAKALYYVGPFQNRGAMPPKAERETTYTMTWTVTNPLNNVSGARVYATLPTYVQWLGVVSPDKEKMTYNEDNRQIVWNIGNVVSGAGRTSAAREVSFQVSLLPSVSQIGKSPVLVNEATLEARDTFTSATVSDVFGALTTLLSNDPYFKPEAEKVVQ